MYNVILIRVRLTIVGKGTNITYSECVSIGLVIQHAKRMRRITLSSVAYFSRAIFSHFISQMVRFSEESF